MFQLIEKLRQKPEKTKKQIAFLVAFSVAGVIFVVWLTIIYPDWRDTQKKEARVINSEPSPISSFTETFSEGISAIGEQFSKITETVSSFTSAPAYYSATSSVEALATSTEEWTTSSPN